jgi:uncharacterized protein YbjT (DUF2867 family)
MNILLFGATGMVGDGVLRWLIASPKVSRVVAVSRKPLSVEAPKLETIIEADMFQLKHLGELRHFDACFFCLGASSVAMSPEDYCRLTYDLTVALARQLLPGNPRMVFEYISGDRTEAKSRQRWAQVNAETETALLKMGFRDAYALRPGFIQPMRSVMSRTRSISWMYALTAPVFPFLQKTFRRWVTSTDLLARRCCNSRPWGAQKKTLNTAELNALARNILD